MYTKTQVKVKWPRLQLALLTIFLDAPSGDELPLNFLQQKVYSKSHKRKPSNARQSVAVLIRKTSEKLGYIGAEIERTTGLGQGQQAHYRLVGNIRSVRKSTADSKKVNPHGIR